MTQIAPYDASIFPLNLVANPSQLTPTALPFGCILGGRLSLRSTYTLTSAQLKALQTTAVQLAPAPGPLLVLVPTQLMLQFKFVTTTYTIGNADNAFQIEYTGKATNIQKTNATGLVDQATSQLIRVEPAVAGTVIAQTNAVNLGLEIKLVGTAPALTVGDGLVNVSLDYDIVPLI
jgi:hypothetical protein